MTELRPSRAQPPTWLALSRLDSSKVLLTSPGPQSGLKMYPPGDTWEGPTSDSSCCHKPWGHSGMPVGQGDLVSLSTKNKALAVTGHQGDWMQKSEPQRHTLEKQCSPLCHTSCPANCGGLFHTGTDRHNWQGLRWKKSLKDYVPGSTLNYKP